MMVERLYMTDVFDRRSLSLRMDVEGRPEAARLDGGRAIAKTAE
jgi:hypothetical protein